MEKLQKKLGDLSLAVVCVWYIAHTHFFFSFLLKWKGQHHPQEKGSTSLSLTELVARALCCVVFAELLLLA